MEKKLVTRDNPAFTDIETWNRNHILNHSSHIIFAFTRVDVNNAKIKHKIYTLKSCAQKKMLEGCWDCNEFSDCKLINRLIYKMIV